MLTLVLNMVGNMVPAARRYTPYLMVSGNVQHWYQSEALGKGKSPQRHSRCAAWGCWGISSFLVPVVTFFFSCKKSGIQWASLIAGYQIQVVELKHKLIKQSFFNLTNSIHRSNKKVQDRVERKSWQEAVRSGVHSVLCREVAGEGKGSGAAENGARPAASAQRRVGGNEITWRGTIILRVVASLWKALYWKWSDKIFPWCLYFSLSSVSAAVRAQEEDGADASNGRTDTSSSNSVSVSNSISSCEVSKIVRSLQVPLACLWPSLLMWFGAFATRH